MALKMGSVYTKHYNRFRGVDFSTDPALIDETRSPYCQNLISDKGGYPEKRLGWATQETYADGSSNAEQINGIHRLVDANGDEYFLVHHKDQLTLENFDETTANVSTGMNNDRSTSAAFDGKLYILDGATYWEYDGTTLRAVEEDSTTDPTAAETFIPTTVIGRLPSGGGTTFEAVNLLTSWRKNSFVGDATNTVYTLDGSIDNATSIVAVVAGTTLTAEDYTLNYTNGTVTFDTAPPYGAGVDNVVITFSHTTSGNADKINKCRFGAWFGPGEHSRFFVSGNPDNQNYDFYSGLYDPTYFPDTGYTRIGSDSSAIMGYLRHYDSLLIIKEANDQDATMFVRTAELETQDVLQSDGEELEQTVAVFPVQQGVAGVGAVSMWAFGTLRDEPLFLSTQGVFTPVLTYGAKAERAMQNRSFFVDSLLTAEADLDEAVAAVWDGYYILSVNGHCYVADSRQRTGESSTEHQNTYEWYYWTNIDARVLTEIDDELWFGTDGGVLCKLRSDESTGLKYNDDDDAIDAIWATKQDDDGDFMTLKTMERVGSGVMVKPYSRSSVEISIRTEDLTSTELNSKNFDIFDFNNMDFDRFTFSTSDSPDVMPFGLSIRKYRSLQIIARNNELQEGFGVYGFIKRFYPVRYVK